MPQPPGRAFQRSDAALIRARIASAFVLCISVFLFACDSANDDRSDTSDEVYVSIGDSVAAGNGASDAATTSFPALVAGGERVELRNVARAGATTQEVLDKQLPDVLALLRGGRVRFITISVGGNDLAGLIPNAACVEDPPPESCPLGETLSGVSERLDEILRQLRAADADVPVVLLGYPNFFAGTGHIWDGPAGAVLPVLAGEMQSIASKFERIAVARPSFDEQSPTMPLTHVLDTPFDPHPNDAGHRIIADAMLSALGDVR